VWQLLDASCEDCRDITSKLERAISREHFIAVRTVMGFPTYHPKNRPEMLSQAVRLGEEERQELTLAPADHPAPLVFLQFDTPTFLTGAEPPSVPHVVAAKIVARGAKLEELAKRTGASAYTVPLPDRAIYARFIGKIAFAFAVGAVGLDAFDEVFVLNAILGKSADVAKWVGCVEGEQWTSGSGDHECMCVVTGEILQVAVRILTRWQAPEYRVIVGRLHPGSLSRAA
jgi:hypothetical protein